MANVTTKPCPQQLAKPPFFSLLKSFSQPLPHYDYDGAAHGASLGTETSKAVPPQYGYRRRATITPPGQGAQPVGNLWHNIGDRYVDALKYDMDINWIHLQPIWERIQEIYSDAYNSAYNAASGNQPPANFQPALWTSLTEPKRKLVAGRLAEEAGKAAVQFWRDQEEGKLWGRIPGTSALAQVQQYWVPWTLGYSAEQERLYMKEQAMQHYNESDVVRASAMYLVHPVMGALNSDPTMHGGFILKSEDFKQNIRTDITFYRNTGTGVTRPIAILEFKRRGVIRPNQFEAAIPAAAPVNVNGPTLFDGEAQKLIKQASTYAVVSRTRHVALCDWNYLVLCYFVDMPYNNPVSVGNKVELQIIPIGTPSNNGLGFNNSNNSRLFRPALLGFLQTAYYETP